MAYHGTSKCRNSWSFPTITTKSNKAWKYITAHDEEQTHLHDYYNHACVLGVLNLA